MPQYLVGRQPIFDSSLDVYGYELLSRDPIGTSAGTDVVSAEVLVNAGLNSDLNSLVGSKRVFITATQSLISGELPVGLPRQQTVIVIPEDVRRDDQGLAGCHRLVADGYLLAIDDFVFKEGDEPLLELASIVKLDLLGMIATGLAHQVELCSGFNVRLLAKNVETHQQFDACQWLGLDLFQGYLLSRPRAVTGHKLTPSQLTCLELIEKLSDPDVSAQDVANIIETDAGLSYRFLHAGPLGPEGSVHRALSSIREGIVLLGTRRLRDWVTLTLLSETHEGPSEQLIIAMTRARMCELLAEMRDLGRSDSAFTIGLVSALDVLLDVPLSEVVDNLSISQDLVAALLDRAGPLGLILSEVLAWELGGEGLHQRSEQDLAGLEQSYLQALAWATEVCGVLEHVE